MSYELEELFKAGVWTQREINIWLSQPKYIIH